MKGDKAGCPLVVDLDGTLIRTDSLQESLLELLRTRPFGIFGLLLPLLRGRAAFKQAVVEHIDFDELRLPINPPVYDFIKVEKQAGRPVLLVTAANRSIADSVAAEVDLFDEVIASDREHNLKGPNKAAVLIERFGKQGFDYIGDSPADLPVWAAARKALVVGDARLLASARQVADAESVTDPTKYANRLGALVRALRPHQWAKNLLLFLPLIAAHQLGDGGALWAVLLAFVAFSLTASSVYLLNDLLDLPADRSHPRKCRRPFAAGDLPLHWGLLLAPGLLIAAGLIGLWLPAHFLLILAGYFLLTTAYSFVLKRKPVVDVLLLAALYTVRVIAGAAAVAIVPSFWLLAFSMFLFLSLALAKRYTELDSMRQRGALTAAGRGWHVDDLPLVQSLGTGAGLASVLVLALYINSPQAQQLYVTSEVLWLVCPLLLYWVTRLWFKTHRGEMHDDPVVFALRDRVSLATGALTAGIVLLAGIGLPS